jgi:hypothetical protein
MKVEESSMKKPLFVILLYTLAIAACLRVGVAIYKWLQEGDKISCVANEFTFGCSTTSGWVFSAIGVIVIVVAICVWEHFRGK